jgi:hypothetical protein
MTWLYSLPELVPIVLAAAALGSAMIWMPRLVQRVPFLRPSPEGFEFSIRMQAPLFTLAALVLTFTLVEAERNFRQVDANVTTEASQLNQLDRLLARYDDPAAQAARLSVRAYTKAVVDEWPIMLARGDGHGSEQVADAFTAMSRAIMAIEPRSPRQGLIYAEMLKSMDVIVDSRDRRLDSLKVSLPGLYWAVILFSVLMLALVSSAIPRTPFRTAILTAQLAVVGAYLGFVFVMDQPFAGEGAVSPAAISKALVSMERRER